MAKAKNPKVQALIDKMAELRTQLVAESKVAFTEAAKEIFDKYPALESFAWTQYAPYFNDGDPCEFSVHPDEPDINGEYGGDIAYSETPHPLRAAQKEIEQLLSSIPEDAFRDMFGDDNKVICKRDGTTETDSCDHD